MTENLLPKDAGLQAKTEIEEQEEVDWGDDPPKPSGSKSPVKESDEPSSGPTLPGPFVKREVEKSSYTRCLAESKMHLTMPRTSASRRSLESLGTCTCSQAPLTGWAKPSWRLGRKLAST